MATPQNKDELLQAISTNFDKLYSELEKLPSGLTDLPDLDGHAKDTKITVSDLVAYLLGWNELVLKWLDNDANDKYTDFPETGYKWNELGKLAQKFYADYKYVPFVQLKSQLKAAKEKIVEEIKKRNNVELYEQKWYGKWTMGRMIQFNTSSPYSNAVKRIRKWIKAI
ncbi:ClbS/DfsB family four-helix bundle protein [Bartonella sp. LJL80]